MSDDTIVDLVMKIRYDLTAAQSKITDLIKALDMFGDTFGAVHIPQLVRAGSPRELAPDVCPTCHIGNNVHTGDCPEAPRNQGRAA